MNPEQRHQHEGRRYRCRIEPEVREILAPVGADEFGKAQCGAVEPVADCRCLRFQLRELDCVRRWHPARGQLRRHRPVLDAVTDATRLGRQCEQQSH